LTRARPTDRAAERLKGTSVLAFTHPLERGSADIGRPEREDQGRDLRPARAASGRPRRSQSRPCDLRARSRVWRSPNPTQRSGRRVADPNRDARSVHDAVRADPESGDDSARGLAGNVDAPSVDTAVSERWAFGHAAPEWPGRHRAAGIVGTSARRRIDQPAKHEAHAAADRDAGADAASDACANAAHHARADPAGDSPSDAEAHAETAAQVRQDQERAAVPWLGGWAAG